MEEVQEMINLKNLDKSSWTTWRFDEIAFKVSETVDPAKTDLEIYVGLEHLDAEDIHIRRKGTPSDVKGGKLRCYPGDIIFGKRRAYQRKAAIVDFDGICSAHAFVFRANPKVINPKLFPFFLHSDAFMHKAVDISVGGLSPTINWGDLKSQEFVLPPTDQQAQLTELLWAMDEVIEKERVVLEVLHNTSKTVFESMVRGMEGEMVPLSDLLIPKKEKSKQPHENTKYIGLEHIESGAFKCYEYGDSNEVLAQCNVIKEGDLCYSKLRPYLDKAFISDFNAVSTTELLIYDTKNISKEYALYHFHSRSFLNYVTGKGFGTKMPRVSHKIIGDYEIKVLNDEAYILESMARFQKGLRICKSRIDRSQALQRSMINEIF
ncbi:MAG: restriction endonuclease subunit S [Cyclobacteriaceae bacterium]